MTRCFIYRALRFPNQQLPIERGDDRLHYGAAAVVAGWCVRVVALIDLLFRARDIISLDRHLLNREICPGERERRVRTTPQTCGTMKSFVLLVYWIKLRISSAKGSSHQPSLMMRMMAGTNPIAASDTFTRGRSRSSRSRRFNSASRRNFRSAILCFLFLIWTGSPPARISKLGIFDNTWMCA